MKANQKSVRGNVQDFLCPFDRFYISQGSFTGNHIGVKATDVSNGDIECSKAPYYAPCDVKCVAQILANGQSYWQSVNKVRIANGDICYISFITAHDETINYGVGFTAKQGEQIGNMGIKSSGIKATGNHCHIQFAKGQYGLQDFLPNKFGVGMFPNEIEIEEACFMDGTNILNGFANWKYLKDVPVVEPIDYEKKYNEEILKSANLTKTIGELNNKVVELTNIANSKQKELDTSKSIIAEKVAEIGLKQQNIDTLNNQVEALKNDKANLTILVENNDKEILELKQENVKLEETIETRYKEISELKASNNELNKKVEELEKTCSSNDFRVVFNLGKLYLCVKINELTK